MKKYTLITLVGLTILALAFGINAALAAPEPVPASQASVIHPDFALRDQRLRSAPGTNPGVGDEFLHANRLG